MKQQPTTLQKSPDILENRLTRRTSTYLHGAKKNKYLFPSRAFMLVLVLITMQVANDAYLLPHMPGGVWVWIPTRPRMKNLRVEFSFTCNEIELDNLCPTEVVENLVYSSSSEFEAPVFPKFLKLAGLQKFRIYFLLGLQLFQHIFFISFCYYITWFYSILYIKNRLLT